MVEPGQKETLKLTAPTQPGNYDYLCTYPEHWKVMFGQLVVVQDMEAFLNASAQSPPPAPAHAAAEHEHHH